MSEEEDPFAEIKALEKKLIKAEEENTKAVNRLNSVITTIGSQSGLLTGGGQRGSGSQLHELKVQSDYLRQLLLKANGQTGKWGEQQGNIVKGGQGGGNYMQFKWDTSKLGQSLSKTFRPLKAAFAKVGGAIKGLWGGLKKSGMLPGIFMGVSVAVGAVMAKVISSSPLLQAMLKLFSTGMTLIFRPIGDFIGSVLRPVMITFIKDVAVPLFQAAKPLVKQGEGIGKLLMGWITDPVKAMVSAITIAMAQFMKPMIGNTKPLIEAHAFSQNAATFARRGAGAGEFAKSKSFSIVPTDEELGLAGYSQEEIGGFNESIWKTGYDWRKIAKVREDMPIPADYKQQMSANPFDTQMFSERIFGGSDNISSEAIEKAIGLKREWWEVGLPGLGSRGTPQNKPPVGETPEGDDFWKGWDDFWAQFYAHAEEENEAREEVTDGLEEFGASWDEFMEYIGDGWNSFGKDVETWRTEMGASFTKWVEGLGTDFEKWTASTKTWIDSAWEWITNFGKVNEAFAEEGDKLVKNEKTWGETIMDWVESIKIAILGTEVATDSYADAIENAAQKVVDAANIATGGIFGGGNTGAGGDDPRGDKNDKDVVASQYDVQPTKTDTSPRGEGNVFGTGTAATGDTGALASVGGKFESSPGKFVDIYSDGKKVDPGSKEGKKIQGIYQKQYDNKQKNAEIKAKQAQVTKTITSAYSPGDAAKARVLAGGGEAGLAAAKFVSDNKLSMTSYGDLVKLGDKFGINHPMIKTAREGLKKQIAMAKTIMQSRINAGQTPSIQGDMLGLFPDAEDSPFGWSDEKLTAQEALYQKNYAEYAALSAGTSNTSSTGYTASASDTGGGTLTSGNFGGTDTSSGWGAIGGGTTTSLGSPGMSGGNPGRTTGGGAGAARSARSGGGRSTGRSTGGAKSGGGSSSKGGAGAARSSRGGSKSGASGASKSGGGSGSKGGAGSARSSRGRGGKKEFGGIIDEPIVGIGIHTGEEYLFGESGRELITPISAGESMGGGGDIVINIGNITKEADYMKLKPLIQRWILEASSRRGTV